jgi:hypothetical protein
MARTSDAKFDCFEGLQQQQECKVCGRLDKFDFHVADEVWRKVVPAGYRNKVVCLACFDKFAFEREIDYSDFFEVLYFAGDQAVFRFQAVSAENI